MYIFCVLSDGVNETVYVWIVVATSVKYMEDIP